MKFCSHLLTPIGPLLTLLMFICDLHALPGGKAAPLNYTGGGGRCSAPETFHPPSFFGIQGNTAPRKRFPFPLLFLLFVFASFSPIWTKAPILAGALWDLLHILTAEPFPGTLRFPHAEPHPHCCAVSSLPAPSLTVPTDPSWSC